MAVLNMKYYSNVDSYSDGNIENDILDIVKGKKEISDFYGEYAVIYHLSPVRENIVNWYPFDKNGNCLEIGAGCGAITGALCQRLNKVVSVDISKRRSEINFERHKTFDNLEIIAGNVLEIEFEKKFDYIVLNGVFEYAMSFTHTSENPYIKFLSEIKKLLKKDGRILIAIENRLGLKYFSGAPEDHTDQYFLGLDNYINNNTVRTFSKNEMVNIINKSGYKFYKFYYPYPDYKFPSEIFTDSTIYEFKYGKDYYNLNSGVFSLFDEHKVAESLAEERIIDHFTNSFFIELGKEKNFSNVIYAKINNDRNPGFRIATIISENEEGRIVEKKPLTSVANAHIDNIYKNSLNKLPENISNGVVNKGKEGIYYNYYSCTNMDDVIYSYINNDNYDEIPNIIKKFFEPFINKGEYKEYHNQEFSKIFGDAEYNSPLLCIRPANIDMICDNIMIDKSGYIIIDTEWIFNIDVPVLFILWRNIRELYTKHPELNEKISFDKMLLQFNIDGIMSDVFRKWTLHFVEYYVGNGITERFAFSKKSINLNTVCNLMYNKVESNLYIKDENGYREDNKHTEILNIDDDGNFTVRFELNQTNNVLRWDPVENRCCKCKIEYINGRAEPLNSVRDNDYDIFENNDPQYIIVPYEKTLVIKGKIYIKDINESAAFFAKKMNSYKGELDYKNIIINEINESNNLLNNEVKILNNKNTELHILNCNLESRIEVNNKSQEYLINQINLLREQVKIEKLKYAEIISSKGWRVIDKLRKFVVLFRR